MISKRFSFFVVLFIAAAGSVTFGQEAERGSAETAQNWDELMHYTLIGKWDLAKVYGQALVDGDPDPVQLLNLAQLERYADSYRNLTLLKADSPIKDIAAKVLELIEQGRFEQRTNPQRIADEVRRLSTTTRGRMLAINRLKDSGEWAVPIMIEALRDPSRHEEFSNIRWALPQLGKTAVNPLVVVLQQHEALNIRLIVLDALGKIGYRAAAPYIQQVIEPVEADSELKAAGLKALRAIYRQESVAPRAASELFEVLANGYYDHVDSLSLASNETLANIWFWDEDEGLVYERVPLGAFDELMTMRCCEYAVELNPHQGTATSLWLSAFFRLEAEGYSQPSYFRASHADASTYALTAGPEYLHRVLTRALKNRNRQVALSAIQVLQRNSGQTSLLYELGAEQPLIKALQYADREIRYSTAITLGQSLPQQAFEHSNLVMPILAEAMGQKGERYALVVDGDQQRRNDLVISLRENGGYSDVVGAEHFAVAAEQSRRFASIDVIILSAKVERPDLETALETISKNYRLAFSPTIVISEVGMLAETRKLKAQYPFLEVVLDNINGETVREHEQVILERNQALVFDKAKADLYAITAADVVQQLAVTGNTILKANEVEATILQAAYEQRQEIQDAAIMTLARIDSLKAQRMLAQLSLDANVAQETRLLALEQLTVSAKAFGNLLQAEHIGGLLAIVRQSDAVYELRNLSAQAYGALNLPSVEINQLIIDQARDEL